MTEQSEQWSDSFGEHYTKRNPSTPDAMQDLYRARFGVDRISMNEWFLDGVDRSARVLEVGCNVGTQLNILSRMGFANLYGVEINQYAIEASHEVNKGLPIWIVRGTALDLPFKDGWFDLVYTSGVLIHVNPDDVATVMLEMARCSRRWVWGFEYFADVGYVEIPYYGRKNMLWKTDFGSLFSQNCPELALVRDERFGYLEDSALVDQMYLLDKEA